MNKRFKLFFLLMVVLSLITTSCDKYSGDTTSISGAWRCREEWGMNGFSQYSVTISKADVGLDPSYFVIYNFHNQGFEVETYVQLIDSTVTISNLGGGFASGKGTVGKDFKTIEWNYTISNETITAFYFR